MKRPLIRFLFLILLTGGMGAEKIADLPRVNRPNDLVVSGDHVYVSDCPRVHIYRLEEGRLHYVKSFGRAGSGPGEFEPNPNHFRVYAQPDGLVVYSRAKVAYFTLRGELIRELNTLAVARVMVPVQDRLVGRRLYMKGGTRYRSVTLFDSRLKQLKTLDEHVYAQQPDNSRIKVYATAFNLAASRHRIFTATSEKFIIRVHDIQGNLLRIIRVPDGDIRVKITGERKKKLHRHLELQAPNYPFYRDRLDFPEFFPAIRYRGLCVDVSSTPAKLYALTWKKRGAHTLVYAFSGNGNLRNSLWLPLREQNALLLFPLCIRGHRLYQLVENPDTETFELHLTTFPDTQAGSGR